MNAYHPLSIQQQEFRVFASRSHADMGQTCQKYQTISLRAKFIILGHFCNLPEIAKLAGISESSLCNNVVEGKI